MKQRPCLAGASLPALVGVLSAHAQRTAPPPRPVPLLSAQQLRDLDAHIEQARRQWEIPDLWRGQ